MVFPSNACNTCKSRRIKCDSSRPSCDRCRKASRTCTWGSDKSQSWPFKNENDFAKGKPRRPRANHDTPLPQNTLHVVTQPPPLGISLSLPIEVYALNYWVTHFTAWPNGLQEIESEYGACALRFWEDCDSRSTLRLAVFAFALAKFGKAVRSSSAIKNAELVYWSCIKRMQAEVASVSNETIDQLLVATVLMALYDVIVEGLRVYCKSDGDRDGDRSRTLIELFEGQS
ncbi:hypothetical protein N7454_003318 [Penicillium verhagenii]|nr:hypothetical protein N7454_003318 [Penicillium verhagenii]